INSQGRLTANHYMARDRSGCFQLCGVRRLGFANLMSEWSCDRDRNEQERGFEAEHGNPPGTHFEVQPICIVMMSPCRAGCKSYKAKFVRLNRPEPCRIDRRSKP